MLAPSSPHQTPQQRSCPNSNGPIIGANAGANCSACEPNKWRRKLVLCRRLQLCKRLSNQVPDLMCDIEIRVPQTDQAIQAFGVLKMLDPDQSYTVLHEGGRHPRRPCRVVI